MVQRCEVVGLEVSYVRNITDIDDKLFAVLSKMASRFEP
jgi:cysteinyl-tRNA synthetase